jgi:hypothetical protein
VRKVLLVSLLLLNRGLCVEKGAFVWSSGPLASGTGKLQYESGGGQGSLRTTYGEEKGSRKATGRGGPANSLEGGLVVVVFVISRLEPAKAYVLRCRGSVLLGRPVWPVVESLCGLVPYGQNVGLSRSQAGEVDRRA